MKGWNAKARVFNSDRSVIASLSIKDAHWSMEYMVDESLDDILTVKGFGNIYVFGDILVVAKVKETWSNIWL